MYCSAGMIEEDSTINNSDITASTSWQGYGPERGRLNYDLGHKPGWGPSQCGFSVTFYNLNVYLYFHREKTKKNDHGTSFCIKILIFVSTQKSYNSSLQVLVLLTIYNFFINFCKQ